MEEDNKKLINQSNTEEKAYSKLDNLKTFIKKNSQEENEKIQILNNRKVDKVNEHKLLNLKERIIKKEVPYNENKIEDSRRNSINKSSSKPKIAHLQRPLSNISNPTYKIENIEENDSEVNENQEGIKNNRKFNQTFLKLSDLEENNPKINSGIKVHQNHNKNKSLNNIKENTFRHSRIKSCKFSKLI